MNELGKQKIKQFLNDKTMSQTVRDVLQNAFMKKKTQETSYLAGQMIAINLLEDGFKELEKLAVIESKESQGGVNVGL